MSASILDPRMIDQLKPLAVTNTNFINITSAFISVPGANSNNWTDTFNVVKDLSSSWSSTFNLVQALSGDWEESVTIAEVSSTAEFLLTTLDDFKTFIETNSAFWVTANLLSTTNIAISSLNARTLALVHDPANDGVDPILDIGETLTGSFSGFRICYEEPTNRLIGSSRTDTTILTSFMINTATGQVGISGLPVDGQALTVTGNISATGTIYSSNIVSNTLTTSVCAMSGNGTTPFRMNFTNGLLTSITF